jgi:hypothetical protein
VIALVVPTGTGGAILPQLNAVRTDVPAIVDPVTAAVKVYESVQVLLCVSVNKNVIVEPVADPAIVEVTPRSVPVMELPLWVRRNVPPSPRLPLTAHVPVTLTVGVGGAVTGPGPPVAACVMTPTGSPGQLEWKPVEEKSTPPAELTGPLKLPLPLQLVPPSGDVL